jgi:hypothetical protein
MQSRRASAQQRGLTLLGLLFWAILAAFVALIAVRVFPTLNEFATIKRAVEKIAQNNPGSVAAVRNAFESQKEVEYSISSIGGKDLEVTKENDRLVIRFAYDKEIELISPVFLVIKYRGESRGE